MEIRFVVDHMLGKLAKYLRFMGYDVYYPPRDMDDDEIIRVARKEGRIVITRDKELAIRTNGIYIDSVDYREQLKIVVKKFNLHIDKDKFLSRCSICNEPLVKISKEEAREKVPEYVYQTHTEFYKCPKCHRIYWYGTHTERIERDLKEILGEVENEDRRERKG